MANAGSPASSSAAATQTSTFLGSPLQRSTASNQGLSLQGRIRRRWEQVTNFISSPRSRPEPTTPRKNVGNGNARPVPNHLAEPRLHNEHRFPVSRGHHALPTTHGENESPFTRASPDARPSGGAADPLMFGLSQARLEFTRQVLFPSEGQMTHARHPLGQPQSDLLRSGALQEESDVGSIYEDDSSHRARNEGNIFDVADNFVPGNSSLTPHDPSPAFLLQRNAHAAQPEEAFDAVNPTISHPTRQGYPIRSGTPPLLYGSHALPSATGFPTDESHTNNRQGRLARIVQESSLDANNRLMRAVRKDDNTEWETIASTTESGLRVQDNARPHAEIGSSLADNSDSGFLSSCALDAREDDVREERTRRHPIHPRYSQAWSVVPAHHGRGSVLIHEDDITGSSPFSNHGASGPHSRQQTPRNPRPLHMARSADSNHPFSPSPVRRDRGLESRSPRTHRRANRTVSGIWTNTIRPRSVETTDEVESNYEWYGLSDFPSVPRDAGSNESNRQSEGPGTFNAGPLPASYASSTCLSHTGAESHPNANVTQTTTATTTTTTTTPQAQSLGRSFHESRTLWMNDRRGHNGDHPVLVGLGPGGLSQANEYYRQSIDSPSDLRQIRAGNPSFCRDAGIIDDSERREEASEQYHEGDELLAITPLQIATSPGILRHHQALIVRQLLPLPPMPGFRRHSMPPEPVHGRTLSMASSDESSSVGDSIGAGSVETAPNAP